MATERIPKGIRLVLVPELSKTSEEAAQELAMLLLATALHAARNASTQAWMVERVEDNPLLTFVLTPLPGQLVSAQNIYSLELALYAQPYVCEVAPLF